MKIALARVPESVTPRLALECDGAFYDVAVLESARGSSLALPTDFHARVFGVGGAGLDETFDRLRSGLRPSRARMGPAEVVLEPPCDVDRAYAFALAPQETPTPHPHFRQLDARGLRGDGALLPWAREATHVAVEGAIAALLGEDLYLATNDDVARAIVGYALMLEWTSSAPDGAWLDRRPWEVMAVQLGPLLVTADEVGRLGELDATMTVGDRSWTVGPFGSHAHDPTTAIRFLSQHVRLRAGDVVGLGRLPGAIAWGEGASGPALGSSAPTPPRALLRPGTWVALQAGPLGPLRGRYL